MEKEEDCLKDYTEEQKEMMKKIVIARLEQIPDNFRLSIG